MKKLLGSHIISIKRFAKLDAVIKKLKALRSSVEQHKSDAVNRALLELIDEHPEPCFLLPAVLEFVQRVDEEKILSHYNFTSFETWLNQFSGLDFEQNYHVRAKLAGKWVERSDYQALFPIGMGKVYEGTHFVTAHKSPDLDTTVASFWGWLDAFAARVGDGLHIWNLPDGPPASQIEIDWIFRDIFGSAVFTHLPKTRTMLTLTGADLLTQQGLHRKTLTDSVTEIDHNRDLNAIVVVDDRGFYLGDWRSTDVEGVRQVVISLSACLRWFENSLHLSWITLFAKKSLRLQEIEPKLNQLLQLQVGACEPDLEFSRLQKEQVDAFLRQIVGVKEGLKADFETLARHLSKLVDLPFTGLKGLLDRMRKGRLFDAKGHLIENRPRIFAFLEKAIQNLHQAIIQIRSRLEKLDIALATKYEVFGHRPNTVTSRSDVEEIQAKMGTYFYLTVVHADHDQFFPVGIIQASNLRKERLGTVSLRDFCNRDEMGIPSYLDVISVIDHHKSAIQTYAPPTAIVSDAQSSNTLVAQKAFEINDASHHKPHFIHPDREFVEYLHFLYAILDDTDLLSKVSAVDVQCVAELLNRLKTLSSGKKSVVVSLRDLKRGRDFPKKAAMRILQNEEMYSLYRKVYQYREKEVQSNMALCAKGEPSNFFADTKEQNGCCRVGQTKMFAANIPSFEKHSLSLQRAWLQKAQQIQQEKRQVDLHIHMISTIVNADEVYQGTAGQYTHKDELWLWIPNEEIAIEHLKHFLSAFQFSLGLKDNPLTIEFLGANAADLAHIFKESFLAVPSSQLKKGVPIAVLKYKAGSLNSRKAMVSPFLPSL